MIVSIDQVSAAREAQPGRDTSEALARMCGIISTLVSISAAIIMAGGIAALAAGKPMRAVTLITCALAARLGVSVVVEWILASAARRQRHTWGNRIFARLALSSPSELHALDTAVDHLADQPLLTATATSAATSLVALVVVYAAAGWVPVAIVVALMGLSVPAYVSVGRHSQAMVDEYHRRRGALVARQLALLRSITDLRALGAISFGADEIAAESDAENRAVLDGVRVTVRSSLVTEFLGGVSVGLVAMVVGIRLWHHSMGLTRALVAVLVVADMFVWLRRYGTEFHRRDDAASAARTLAGVAGGVAVEGSGDLIEARAIVTEAPSAATDLVVAPGARIRIIGPSGIGKTSLIEVALGLRAPVSGTVRRGAGRIGLVRADSRMLRASLRENLDPCRERRDDEISATVTAVGLSASRFGNLDDLLDDDARSISSGERVQLAVARALLARVDVLVIDDVAGLLDESTRARISPLIDAHVEMAVVEACHDVALIGATSTIRLEPA